MSRPLPPPAPEALTWRFSRAGGPGGQHVNTSSTRVELDCDLRQSGYPPAVVDRLTGKLGEVVRVTASDTRSQRRNRELAVERLMAQLDAANVVPRTRRPTRPKRSAVEQRLSDKHRASRRKQDRSWRDDA